MYKFIISAAAFVTGAVCLGSRCRCRPDDSCWPSPRHWQTLNSSVQGNLAAVLPVASVCHDPTFDDAACAALAVSGQNSAWRAAQPGAVQWQNWEALPTANQSCYLESPKNLPCEQGRVSVYSVMAESPKHIQEAVRFARRHNIKLVIKNSGHDFLGRSSAPHSLQIATHKMNNLLFTDNFVVQGTHGKNVSYGPAVTVGAGVLLKDLYTAVGARGLTVVGGLSHTVGLAGGYIQGGGHSPLGTWKGMASDNAIEFSLITAMGDVITVNQFLHPDLFWALRGGGGGTFGVVASVTILTYPDVPLLRADLGFETAIENGSSFWDAIRDFHAHLSLLNDAGASGYYSIVPRSPKPNDAAVSSFLSVLFFPNQTDQARIHGILAPLALSLNISTGGGASYVLKEYSRIRDLFEEILPDGSDKTGGFIALGSRLVSREFLTSETGPTRLAEALSKLRQEPGDEIRGHIVAGGRVAEYPGDTALNPAWRKTLTHISIGHIWGANTTLEEQQAIQANITQGEVVILKSLEPGKMGAYLNEADANEVDFQSSFWGENYNRLYEIKQRWDVDGLFINRRGVGSENWDNDGLCRIR